MAFWFHSLRHASSLLRITETRCTSMSRSHFSVASFSDACYHCLEEESSAGNLWKRPSNACEYSILRELSDLLPLRMPLSNSKSKSSSVQCREDGCGVNCDGYLSPEERLRGVFLQRHLGEAALENALTNVGVDLSLDVVADVVNHGNMGGRSMVQFFRWAIKQPTIVADTHAYNVLLKALGRRKYLDSMEEILFEMKSSGICVDEETLSIVMVSYLRARRLSKATEFFGRLKEFGWECSTESLNLLLQTICQRGHAGAANLFLNSMKGKVPFNVMTYNMVIHGWTKFGRVDKVRNVMQMMEADGFAPDNVTFGYLIESLGRSDKNQEAVNVLNGMTGKGIEPDVSMYNAMIANFALVGNFDECVKYYQSMLGEGCKPDLCTYNHLVSAFVKYRKVADALEMFDEMLKRQVFPNTGMVTLYIESLCKYGPPYAAMTIYSKARKAGCKISLKAYKLLLMRLSRFGKCGMMLNLWEEMREAGHPCDVEVYEHVVNGLCNNGQLENAVLVMEELLRKGFFPSRLIYSKLNNKLLASSQTGRAYGLFLKIKEARRHENARRYWRSNGWHF
ncbi:hypothetical protein MLD38_035032 [Melastoma candidum]|uniref:Uncharacterized protein n=1 Tax=Melastoma candidum TaxID=119954 RepID=A0ACB9MF25_9MYRT|nr:hypothetical protein MLD38_035032 [Melastoma candidum]